MNKNCWYTSFDLDWDFLLLRYIDDTGERHNKRIKLKPYLFIPSALENSEYETYDGKPVMRVDFNSIREARDFARSYEGTPNFKIYGSPLYHYVHIYENFKNQKPDLSKINILNFDIETDTSTGYGDIRLADKEINAITMKLMKSKDVFVLGFKPYDAKTQNTPEIKEILDKGYRIHYKQCENEKELLRYFVEIWQRLDPNVVTGWNTNRFDIPTIIKRLKYNFDDDYANKLSPFGKINHRVVTFFNKESDLYDIVGVQSLDYMEVYKKFSQSVEESYSLNYLSNKILNSSKLDYSEYGSLANLYAQNPELFISYNIIDVIRVEEIDEQVKYMDIAFEIAYETLCNYTDSFTTIRNWDTMIHNYLMDQKRVVPFSTDNRKERSIAGGYVKDPQVGRHKWVISYDYRSLYPHLSMTFNISPDTYLGTFKPIFGEMSVQKILDGQLNQHQDMLVKQDVTIAGNGAVYSRKKKGFITALMETLFAKRAEYQEEEEKWEKIAAANPDNKEAERKSTIYGNKSYATKILANSGFGATSNEHFRFFHDNIAESFTLSGQLAIRTVTDYVNTKLNQYMETTDVDYVIAADTDSGYFRMDEVVDRFCKGDPVDFLERFSDKIQGWINEALEIYYKRSNVYQKKLSMALEAIGPAIWIAKKRYVMSLPSFKKIRYNPPKIKIMGIEAVRSTTPLVARNWIKDGIPLALNGEVDNLKKFIDQRWDEFSRLSFSDIAMPKGTNDLEKYTHRDTIYVKATPLHVRGALLFNEYIKKNGWDTEIDTIKSGDRVKVMYLTLPNPLMENVISVPEELPGKLRDFEQYADRAKQFDKTFLDAFKRITNAAGLIIDNNIGIDDFYE